VSLQIRTLHAYVGALIAPAVIFFATTGLLQIYSLHEAHPGYTPPALLEELGSVHKDQRVAMEHRAPTAGKRPPPPSPPRAGNADDEPRADKPHNSHTATNLLKAFFAFVAIGLIFSAGSGIWMALQQTRRRRTHCVLLLIGTLVPVILAALTA
jgi:hypothetical protein